LLLSHLLFLTDILHRLQSLQLLLLFSRSKIPHSCTKLTHLGRHGTLLLRQISLTSEGTLLLSPQATHRFKATLL
tara:strand:+ start:420 stop:644 length:225 start_codon:yes stop_codon:yes gene_type:complete